MLDETLGFLDDHVGHLHVTAGRFVEGRRDHFTAHRTLHLRHFLRPLVDEQDHEVDFGIVGGNRRRDVLQQHRLTGLRRGDDQTALALTDRRHHVDDACGQVLGAAVALLQQETVFREQRRQVLEQNLPARVLGCVVVDLADFEQREITLAVLRRTDQPGNGVAGAQREASNLARADVDIVRTGKIRSVRGAQEAEPVLQDLEYTFSVDVLTELCVLFEDREDDVLLAGTRETFEAERLAELDERGSRPSLELGQVHDVLARFELLGRYYLETCVVIGILVLWWTPPATTIAALLVAGLRWPALSLITQVSSHRLLSRNSVS